MVVFDIRVPASDAGIKRVIAERSWTNCGPGYIQIWDCIKSIMIFC